MTKKGGGVRRTGVVFCVVMITEILAWAGVSPKDVPVLYAPVSARSSALGNSLYCFAEEGGRYNPAYLGFLQSGSLFATYGNYLRGTKFGILSFQEKKYKSIFMTAEIS